MWVAWEFWLWWTTSFPFSTQYLVQIDPAVCQLSSGNSFFTHTWVHYTMPPKKLRLISNEMASIANQIVVLPATLTPISHAAKSYKHQDITQSPAKSFFSWESFDTDSTLLFFSIFSFYRCQKYLFSNLLCLSFCLI